MKIGLITSHRSHNYGAALQAYALQHTLTENGFSSEYIDYYPTTTVKNNQLFRKGITPGALIANARTLLHFAGRKKRIFAFEDFQTKYLNISRKKYYSLQELERSNVEYDIFMTGSDQTLNLHLTGNISERKPFYLSFVTDKPKVSYASSFGDSLEKYTDEDIRYIKTMLAQYSTLSVREKNGADFLRDECGLSSNINVDPTLLLHKEQWEQIRSTVENKPEQYILFYSVLSNSDVVKQVKKASKVLGLPVVAAHPQNRHELLSGFIRKDDCGPSEFVDLIKNAAFVCTTSFHATVFSLIYNVKFISFAVGNGDRVKNLLSAVDMLEKQKACDDFNIDYNLFISDSFDFEKSNSIIQELKIQSIEYLKNIINPDDSRLFSNSISKIINVGFIPHSECVACEACRNICPRNCIEMSEDEYGCLYPKLDTEKCIKCGRCLQVCQVIYREKGKLPAKSYAAWAKQDSIRMNSTSGGIASILSERFIDNGGMVVGAAINDTYQTTHRIIRDKKEIRFLQGSKYVQSKLCDVYIKIQSSLDSGAKVLFFGNPCQVSGLYNFLGKNYDKLYTCELICHGVSPFSYLKEDAEKQLETTDLCNLRYSFREKRSHGLFYRIFNGDKCIYLKPFYKNMYYLGFEKGLSLRENCYNCHYARPERISDLTIGDYAKLGKTEHLYDEQGKGLSTVLINTEKGNELFELSQKYIFMYERPISDMLKRNRQLNVPVKKHSKRSKFLKGYKETSGDFDYIASRCLIKDRIKYYLLYSFIGDITRSLIQK